MDQVVGTGRANRGQAGRILAANEIEHVLAVFEAQDLALVCRDQAAQQGCDLCGDVASLFGCQCGDTGTTKDCSVSAGDARLNEVACLGDRRHGRGVASLVGVTPGD